MSTESSRNRVGVTFVHVFMGRRYHHNLGMIETILRYSKKSHFFIIYFTDEDEDNGSRYREFFQGLGHTAYGIGRVPSVKSLWERKITVGIRSAFSNTLHYLLFKNRKSPIIFHGEYTFRRGDRFLLFLFSAFFRSITWICWGYIPGRQTNKKGVWIRKINGSLERLILRQELARFRRIVCLLDGDQKEIVAKHNLSNVVVIPYPREWFLCEAPIISNSETASTKCRVLLGNNAINVSNYGEIVDKLAKFAGKIYLKVMLNYGKPPRKEYEAFVQKAQMTFGGDFEPWTELVPKRQYVECLKEQDVYICNSETQSGLGAIYYSLILGKKVYLRGYNYDWIKRNGFIVFHVEDILKEDYAGFFRPLSLIDKKHNYDTFNVLFKNQEVEGKWESLFDTISMGVNGLF